MKGDGNWNVHQNWFLWDQSIPRTSEDAISCY